jgi:hypothetical protein
MPAANTNTSDDRAATALVGRQVRLPQVEYDALWKAAPHGQQNAYILKALRAQLRRDGHLTSDDKQPSLFRGSKARRRRSAR